ncbi:MAG: phosphotransferase [Akkermansiaceae bacterium]
MFELEKSRHDLLCRISGAKRVVGVEKIQQLWSGYGELLRCQLEGGNRPSVIVKDVDLGGGENHPRGWNTDVGHQRKLRSYEVEAAWYETWSSRCTEACRVPRCLAVERDGGRVCMVLEDLDAVGFPCRCDGAGLAEAKTGLRWLAAFHANFLDSKPEGLWESGTYWHLGTRIDEWDRLPNGPLKDVASAIDESLSESRFQTIVHGDAKLANFCFSEDGESVAAVDFQYVGGGCGMKDVAYFIGSVFEESNCERFEEELLGEYFCGLRKYLPEGMDAESLEDEWRALYPVAWTDFHRFLLGWSPGHWKLHGYSERLTQQTIEKLTQ